MSLRRLRRLLALFALALAVCAAVPCSLLAAEDACCGSAAGCGDAAKSPCSQLTAAPCCEASGAPLEISVTVKVRDTATDCPRMYMVELLPELLRELAQYTPPALDLSEISHRTVILRL